MNYAIIAAGDGTRFQAEGADLPKQMMPVDGHPMLGRILYQLTRHNARSISVIINDRQPETLRYLQNWSSEEHLYQLGLPESFRLRFVVKSTSSSMHSLDALREILPPGKFCLTTVDTVFDDESFSRLISTWQNMDPRDADGLFAVTSFVDDEKPLYVDVINEVSGFGDIANFYDIPLPGKTLPVSGGIYCLDTASAYPVLERCLSEGQSKMRNFQRALIQSGRRIRSFRFPKILDIDHISDVPKAEDFLRGF